jgi:hypothetical protein
MFILASTTWSDAFAIIGVAFAAAFAIWAMFKYSGNKESVSDVKISEHPWWYSYGGKPVERDEEECE